MKCYAHFDKKKHWSSVKHIVENPEMVAKHPFFPFIHYVQRVRKFNIGKGRQPPKEREIFYSSHIDRYIYEYYAYKLNCLYNQRVKEDGINKCAIAYRNNLHKSNINFAKEVFDFIRKKQQAFIIIGDFKNFFDSLDHSYLKERLCNLLKTDLLPDDYYAVFKSVTKYSYFDLDKLLKITGLKYKELNQKERVLDLKDFRFHKKKCLKKNKENYGIPQGSAISAVLSNIYMLEFDKKINNFVTSRKGLYRRYSDDFVVVFPKCTSEQIKDYWSFILNVIKSVKNLTVAPEKTKVFEYKDSQVRSCNSVLFNEVADGKNIIDYLGFSFDGKVVTIRDKTITKYYYRMYRKIDTIVRCKGVTKHGNKIPLSNLYRRYSFLGAKLNPKKRHKGNFLTYVERAKKIFGLQEAIDRGTKRHWGKLQKRLHRVIPEEDCQ